jgi:DNA recombination protein RmuC
MTMLREERTRLATELQREQHLSSERHQESTRHVHALEEQVRAREQELQTDREQLASVRDELTRTNAELSIERIAAGERVSILKSQLTDLEALLGARSTDLDRANSEVVSLQQERARLIGVLAGRNADFGRANADIVALQQERARLTGELEVERSAHADKLAMLQQAESRLAQTFANLSASALRENTRAFLDLAGASLDELQRNAATELDNRHRLVEELVQPVRDSLHHVEAKLQELETERHETFGSVSDELQRVAEAQHELQRETRALVSALRTPAGRGPWGQVQLRRVVEMAGMAEYCDFQEEQRVGDEDTLTSDVVVRLPGGRTIVIDARGPVEAYLQACEATDEQVRGDRLLEHAEALRNHLARLGSRNYWNQFSEEPEFVFMFLPGEGFLSAALERDPSLLEFAVRRGVIPATPLTLIALLRAVGFGWRQERLAQDAHAVRALGRELYERVAELATHWTSVGESLSRSVEAYNRSVAAMEQRMLVSARRLAGVEPAIPPIEPVDRVPRQLQGSTPEAVTAAGPEHRGEPTQTAASEAIESKSTEVDPEQVHGSQPVTH